MFKIFQNRYLNLTSFNAKLFFQYFSPEKFVKLNYKVREFCIDPVAALGEI